LKRFFPEESGKSHVWSADLVAIGGRVVATITSTTLRPIQGRYWHNQLFDFHQLTPSIATFQ